LTINILYQSSKHVRRIQGYANRPQIEVKKINNEYRSLNGRGSGRPTQNIDDKLDAIWWILKTGAMWRALPDRYGKWNSAWRCFRRWCQSGLWEWVLARTEENHPQLRIALMVDASHVKVHQDATRSPLTPEDQKFGKTKGGRNTKLSACVNIAGRCVRLQLVPGNEHDSKSFRSTLPEHISGSFILADKGYDTDEIRNFIKASAAYTVIPPKKNRKVKIDHDKQISKLRAAVENFFARIKRFRRINTRYDQLPSTYLGFVNLAAVADYGKLQFVHAA